MSIWSSAGWAVHDLGLAFALGGAAFGKLAMHPAIKQIPDGELRDRVVDVAWRRFSVLNLASHVAFAVPWVIGRRMLSGREASGPARRMTLGKDILVGASLLTGLGSIILGRVLGREIEQGEGPSTRGNGARKLEQVVGALGTVNMTANAGILGLTSLLAMQSSKSARFPFLARKLP